MKCSKTNKKSKNTLRPNSLFSVPFSFRDTLPFSHVFGREPSKEGRLVLLVLVASCQVVAMESLL